MTGRNIDDDVQPSVEGNRLVVLGNLEVLRHVRIEVILPGEPAVLGDLAVQSQPDPDRRLHGVAVDHRYRPGQSQRHRIYLSIRLGTELGSGPAEHLRPSAKFDVYLETEHWIEPSDRVLESRQRRRRGYGHGRSPSLSFCRISRTTIAMVTATDASVRIASASSSLSPDLRALLTALTPLTAAKPRVASRIPSLAFMSVTPVSSTPARARDRASSGPIE